MLSPLTDEPLRRSVLERIASGDSAAVNACISQYGGLVWSLARRFTRTRADAEDATQEVFLSIWRSATAFDPALGSEKVFVAMIARRRLIDRRRRCKGALSVDCSVNVEEAVGWTDAGAGSQTSVDADAAMWALRQLKPQQRRMLELSLMYGLSQSEIAAELSLPLSTVKSSLRRGLIQVREYMQIEAQAVARTKREGPFRVVANDMR